MENNIMDSYENLLVKSYMDLARAIVELKEISREMGSMINNSYSVEIEEVVKDLENKDVGYAQAEENLRKHLVHGRGGEYENKTYEREEQMTEIEAQQETAPKEAQCSYSVYTQDGGYFFQNIQDAWTYFYSLSDSIDKQLYGHVGSNENMETYELATANNRHIDIKNVPVNYQDINVAVDYINSMIPFCQDKYVTAYDDKKFEVEKISEGYRYSLYSDEDVMLKGVLKNTELNAYNAALYIKDCIFGRGLYPETLQPIAETADKGELKKNLNIVTEQQEQNTDIERADKQLAEDVCNFVNNELAEDEPLSFEAVEHSILRSDGRAIDDMRIQSALYTVRNKNKDRKMSYEYLKSEELIGFVEACYKKNSEKVVSNDSKQIEAARRR